MSASTVLLLGPDADPDPDPGGGVVRPERLELRDTLSAGDERRPNEAMSTVTPSLVFRNEVTRSLRMVPLPPPPPPLPLPPLPPPPSPSPDLVRLAVLLGLAAGAAAMGLGGLPMSSRMRAACSGPFVERTAVAVAVAAGAGDGAAGSGLEAFLAARAAATWCG